MTRQNGLQSAHGYCFWIVERREDGAMLGFCGLKPGPADTPIEGRVEIGWRLRADAWGKGYAREAAQASLDWVSPICRTRRASGQSPRPPTRAAGA